MTGTDRGPSTVETLSDFNREDAERTVELFKLFGSSANRILFFTAFIEGTTEAELRDRFGSDVAENTVTNNIEAFEEAELIYHSEKHGEYRVTEFGKRLVNPFREVVELAHCHEETRPLLRHLPAWDRILDFDDLKQIPGDDIKEYTGRREMIHLYSDYEDIVRGNSSIREILTWNAHENRMRNFVEMFTDGETTGELILKHSEIIDQAPNNGGITRETAELLAENGAELYVYEGDYPGVLFIGDETAALWGWGPDETYYQGGIYEGDGLYDWAIDQFEDFKAEADADWESYDWVDDPHGGT